MKAPFGWTSEGLIFNFHVSCQQCWSYIGDWGCLLLIQPNIQFCQTGFDRLLLLDWPSKPDACWTRWIKFTLPEIIKTLGENENHCMPSLEDPWHAKTKNTPRLTHYDRLNKRCYNNPVANFWSALYTFEMKHISSDMDQRPSSD